MVDLTVNLSKDTTIEEVNKALKDASEGRMRGILAYSTEELVSTDYNGSTFSIYDVKLTNFLGNRTLKLVTWHDNESGFSNRVINLAELVASSLK